MQESIRSASSGKSKPAKPYPDFPLFPHATKRWAKKIRGKTHYFGPWNDPQGSLVRFNREWPYLSDGRTPPSDDSNGCTIRTLCNKFLDSKRAKLESDELSARSFGDYHSTCKILVAHFGKDWLIDDIRPDDFQKLRTKLARRLGVVSLKNEINRIRSVFKFAKEERLIDREVNYGQSFDRPDAKAIRKSRNEAGENLFEADELKRILKAAEPMMKAMVLLGLNCGFGNTDCASLPRTAVDLDSGWINFPRPKTQIKRRIPLWPETVEALRVAASQRPEPRGEADAGIFFLTIQGNRWVRIQPSQKDSATFVTTNNIAHHFGRVLRRLKINGRKNLGFYTLRHTFATIAGESRDQVAVNSIMGHVDASMAAVYRERISDERLQDVVNVVRAWLWPDGVNTDESSEAAAT